MDIQSDVCNRFTMFAFLPIGIAAILAMLPPASVKTLCVCAFHVVSTVVKHQYADEATFSFFFFKERRAHMHTPVSLWITSRPP